MLSLFKSQQPSNLIFFLLLLVAVRFPLLFITPETTDGLLQLEGVSHGFQWLLTLLIIGFQAIWFNYIFTEAQYTDQKTLVPAAVWAVLSVFHSSYAMVSDAILLQFVVLALMHTLIDIRQQEASQVQCFNAGFLNGILIVVYPVFLIMIPFTLAGLYVLRTFRARDYFLALLGASVPLFWSWSIFYLFENPLMFIERLTHQLGVYTTIPNYFIQGKAIFLLLLAIVGLFMLSGLVSSAGFKRKKNVRISLFLTVGLLLTCIFHKSASYSFFYILSAPLTWVIAILMLRIPKNLIAEVLFGIFVLSLFVVQFFEAYL